MPSETGVDELAVVATVEREVAVVGKLLTPSGGNDEELVVEVDVERDEAAMKKLLMPA